ncbi:GtrA family protein [uncultured Bacteroides sp.]|uniref:GtrA family protein n=1 Tax=uncultured Bacteroides sp. TaxID=162156 RepID=UPI002AAAC860|nr:GtrA family protein [uncultured Bacteroides sp.]
MIEKLFVFTKAQVSSFFGGVVDYSIMILCTELLGIHYTISIAIGGIIGAIINFSLNKKWTFQSKDSVYKHSSTKQLALFALVVANSIALKAAGTYCFTTFCGIKYGISRIITDLIVSVLFNYMLQRHWVFKKIHS